MAGRLFRLTSVLGMLLMATAAYAQGGSATSSLSGVVVDKDGGVVPGATVVVKNNATGATFNTVTNSTGSFSAPALDAGTYTVSVSLSGFKTAVINDVRLLAGVAHEIKATLEIGNLTETVEVKGGGELVNTTTPIVSATLSIEQVANLPLVSRNALNFVTFLPGVQTTGGPRGSTISGLPQNTINITLDGISVSNNLQSGDGFFSLVVPSIDALEEVTVATAAQGADAAGSGATQIKFVTRSGTNQYSGSGYHYFRHPSLNTNYYFNKVNKLDKNRVILHQAGGRIGGPIILPGLDGRGRAFFFFNYEQFYQPTEITRTRTMLNPDAERGIFTYSTAGGLRQVNLLALAAANGQISTPDPTIAALIAQIRSGAQTTGNITTPENATLTESYVFQAPARGDRYFPTSRVDFNLGANHRLSGSYYWQRFVSSPDLLNNREPRFPGLTNFGEQTSYRTSASITMRSTLSQNLVNEVLGGWQWSPVQFFTNVTAGQFDSQAGFAINFPSISNLTDPSNTTSPSWRNTMNWNIDNTLNWLRGNHAWRFGASFTQISHDQNSSTVVPEVVIGLDTNNDPARLMFNTANFPGASSGDLANARALYALMTGRITQITGTGRLSADTNQYVYNGNLNQQSRMNDLGLFVQDTWRIRPNVTLNYGLRWELQFPFYPLTTNWSSSTLEDLCGISGIGAGPGGRQCNLYQPGNIAAPDVQPKYVQYEPGRKGYATDWNNFAPNIGVAWQPMVQDGWLRALLGDPEQATFRGGYSVTYNRPRMDQFTGLFGGNPGGAINANRNVSRGNLVLPGESWPVLLRESSRLGPPDLQQSPEYPILAAITLGNDINIFDPNTEVPYTRSWQIGFQRALSRDMAFELRYVGNRNEKAWFVENWNDVNIFESGFLDEFRLAQQNLRAHVMAGCGSASNPCSFAYRGPGTGTSPLPIYLAFFSGVAPSQAGDASRYTSSNFRNSAWTDHLGVYEPDPYEAAEDLWGSSTFRNNASRAGLPGNFFVMNPAIDNANMRRPVDGDRYHSLQFDIRRRLSRGLTLQANYTYGLEWELALPERLTDDDVLDFHQDRIWIRDAGVPHAFKMSWVYEIPIGRGRRFGSNMNPWINGVIGNWEFSGTGRVQTRDFIVDGARLVGMSQSGLQDIFKIRIVRDPVAGSITVLNMPDDFILNTRRAFNTDPTSLTGYSDLGVPEGRYFAPLSTPDCVALHPGDCGAARQVIVNGPLFSRFDFRLKKLFPFGRRGSFELNFEVLNVFDAINFNPAFNPGGGTNVFRVTSAYTDPNTTQDPGGRLGQLVWRINW